MTINKIGILGAGSWGTTLANHIASKGMKVTLWARRVDVCENIKKRLENPDYLPGIRLSSHIKPTTSLKEAVQGKELLITAIPTYGLRNVMLSAEDVLSKPVILSTTKGIEESSLLTPSQIIYKSLPLDKFKGIGVLSGPSFAKEVCSRLPTAVTAASEDRAIAELVQNTFNTEYFRVYTNSDVTGVELGGALKNIIAIAAGIADGLGLGGNSRAALITRGLAEITRLGIEMGAKAETFSGLSGLGDLVLTCTGALSRNRHVGMMLGRGHTLKKILKEMNMVAEGVKTTRSARELSEKLKVEMPITKEVYNVLYGEKSPKDAVIQLMMRGLRQE